MNESEVRRCREELLRMIEAEEPLESLRERLLQAKNAGLRQDVTLQFLGALRGDVSTEQKEDVVLELMDFAHGFCSPAMRIWQTHEE